MKILSGLLTGFGSKNILIFNCKPPFEAFFMPSSLKS